MHFAVTGQTDLAITDSSLNGMIANGRGGLAYFEGTNNYVKVNGVPSVISNSAPSAGGTLQGGLFYMAGTLINDIELMTGSSVSDVSTTSHGGLFYLNGDD